MNWHARYEQQARWTADLRKYLFEGAGLQEANTVLEVGCGTGAVLAGLRTPAALHGLDISFAALAQARTHAPAARLTCGDAHQLPYPGETFDLTCCHFLLLWVAEPLLALSEMARVTRRGGSILAMAEPDYSARSDAPAELAELGRLQTRALEDQGADTALGARLAELFSRAGIRIVETGTLQPAGSASFDRQAWELEWAVLQEDLGGSLPEKELHRFRQLDLAAWESGERRLHVPTCFAWGQVQDLAV